MSAQGGGEVGSKELAILLVVALVLLFGGLLVVVGQNSTDSLFANLERNWYLAASAGLQIIVICVAGFRMAYRFFTYGTLGKKIERLAEERGLAIDPDGRKRLGSGGNVWAPK